MWFPAPLLPLVLARKPRAGRRPKAHRGPVAQRRPFPPGLEVLEGRTVPSTLTVLNNLDSGAGSLRDAIAQAKRGDTITFSSSLAGQTITLTWSLIRLSVPWPQRTRCPYSLARRPKKSSACQRCTRRCNSTRSRNDSRAARIAPASSITVWSQTTPTLSPSFTA